MSVQIREMTMIDYPAMSELWQTTPGIGLSTADTPAAISRYLKRNPGFSFVAYDGDLLVGTVLAGNDGRRGYLYHLAVRESHRRLHLGETLVKRSLEQLAEDGIEKCHIMVYGSNDLGKSFWSSAGWYERPELVIMSCDL